MRHRTQLNSRIYFPRGGPGHPTHARTLARVATRTTTDKLETPYPKLKPGLGLDREMLYIVGGLAVTSLTWYYDATVENASIEKKRGCSDRIIPTV